MSSVYYTEPQNVKEQPWFANQVARVICDVEVTPQGLLTSLLNAELALGRERGEKAVRFGPRVIDIDLLLFGNEVILSNRLEVPHPRMKERAFVLVPLFEVAGDMLLPDGESLESVLSRIDHRVEDFKIWQD